MQNKIFIAAITATITIASISSCKKDDHNHNASDTEKPVITLNEPVMNDTISLAASSGEVHIDLAVSDNDKLHDVAINVTNGSTNIFTKSAHVDAKTYTFHDHIMPMGITGVTALTLKIDASDHNSNSDSKTVTFYVKP